MEQASACGFSSLQALPPQAEALRHFTTHHSADYFLAFRYQSKICSPVQYSTPLNFAKYS